jgi:hypothetical protein
MVNAGYESLDNPYGIEALGGLLRAIGAVSAFVLLLTVLASVFSIVVRFRRSRGDERRQIKWVAYAGAVVALVLILQIAAEAALTESGLLVEVLNLGLVVAFIGVPIAAGIAILKYRLYEIDTIINRTLVYVGLTALLALVYVWSVIALQYIFRTLTGGESSLAVVASTLAIAALFNPLRRRIQALVDHRFYRRKYDAAKTLAAFSARLRDETDLNSLRSELVTVVRETVQPARVSVWLRPQGEDGERKR